MNYTKEYFIEKFEAIPENKIGRYTLSNHCALWHCGVRNYGKPTEEAIALSKLFETIVPGFTFDEVERVYSINDGTAHEFVKGETPKERILNALKLAP